MHAAANLKGAEQTSTVPIVLPVRVVKSIIVLLVIGRLLLLLSNESAAP